MMMTRSDRLYILACACLCLVVLVLCLIAAHGCSGVPQAEQPIEDDSAQATVQVDSAIDLGFATIDLQAAAIVEPPDEVSVYTTATVRALTVLRIRITLVWVIVPEPPRWRVCVEGLGMERCADG